MVALAYQELGLQLPTEFRGTFPLAVALYGLSPEKFKRDMHKLADDLQRATKADGYEAAQHKDYKVL